MRSYSRFKRSRRKFRWRNTMHAHAYKRQSRETTEQAQRSRAAYGWRSCVPCWCQAASVAPRRCDSLVGACSSRTRRRDRSGRRNITSAKSRGSRRRWARRSSGSWRPRRSLAAKKRRRGMLSRSASLRPLPRKNSPGCFCRRGRNLDGLTIVGFRCAGFEGGPSAADDLGNLPPLCLQPACVTAGSLRPIPEA
jgi:hypothetical protein